MEGVCGFGILLKPNKMHPHESKDEVLELLSPHLVSEILTITRFNGGRFEPFESYLEGYNLAPFGKSYLKLICSYPFVFLTGECKGIEHTGSGFGFFFLLGGSVGVF